MFEQFFRPLQMKQGKGVNNNKLGICKLPQELPSDLRLDNKLNKNK